MRRAFLALPLVLLLTACGGAAPAARPASLPAAQPAPSAPQPGAQPAPPAGPDLLAQTAQHKLSPDEMQRGLLRYLNQGEGTPVARLDALFQKWGLKPSASARLYTEADLRGDGQTEVIATLKSDNPTTGPGALFVIYKQDGHWAVDRTPRTDLPGVDLLTVAPLTGDNRQVIVWSATGLAANSPPTRYFFSVWQPGGITNLPGSGDPYMVYPRLAIEGKDVVLRGGLMGSAGSGVAQRARIDVWRFTDGAFKLADRAFDPHPESYFRLEDGIVAEQFGHAVDARSAYGDATEPSRAVAPDAFFPPSQGDLTQLRQRLGQAVGSFARFRAGLLALDKGDKAGADAVLSGDSGPFAGLTGALQRAGQRAAGCASAEAWAQANPDFLKALNSPFGFGKVTWKPEELCGPLPLPFLDGPNPPK